jgi:hypothetical protein
LNSKDLCSPLLPLHSYNLQSQIRPLIEFIRGREFNSGKPDINLTTEQIIKFKQYERIAYQIWDHVTDAVDIDEPKGITQLFAMHVMRYSNAFHQYNSSSYS